MGTTKKAKALLREQKGLSSAKARPIAGAMMAKNSRYFQTNVHKSITRDQFLRSINPAVGARMRELLNALKRKGAVRE